MRTFTQGQQDAISATVVPPINLVVCFDGNNKESSGLAGQLIDAFEAGGATVMRQAIPLITGIMHLTYLNSAPHIGTASPADSGEAGAPGNEIEITPEMIEAGLDAYYGLCEQDWEDDSRRCVTEIISAVVAAARL